LLSSGNSHLRRAAIYCLEIAATQFFNNDSGLTTFIFRHRRSFMQMRGELRADTFERENAVRFQQRKKFLVDDSYTLHK
jgi:hypothetical protein